MIEPILVLGCDICRWHNVVDQFHGTLDGHIAEGDSWPPHAATSEKRCQENAEKMSNTSHPLIMSIDVQYNLHSNYPLVI